MKSSLALAAVAAAIAVGSFVGSTQKAAALDLSFLNQMNPEYKRCVNNVRSQIRGPIDSKLHDAIIDSCNRRYPMYPRR